MARPRTLGALAALLLAAAGPGRAGAPSDAPLGVATPGLLRSLFLDMPLADARGGGAAVDLRWWMANSWSVPTSLARDGRQALVQLDAQTDALQVSATLPWARLAATPLTARLSTTVEARAFVTWGGWSDGGIEGWHRLIRASSYQRERWPRDAVAVTLAEPGGAAVIALRSSRLALGDVALRTALRVAGDDPGAGPPRWAVALRADVKLPVGAPARLGGSGGPDAGVGVAATVAAWPWLTAHALGSVRVVSRLPGRLALQPRRLQAGLDLSLVARLGPVALVAEDRISTPLMEGGWALAPTEDPPVATAYYALFRAHNQLSAGVRVGELTAFFSEDFTPGGARLPGDGGPGWFHNAMSPDVVLGVAWARSF